MKALNAMISNKNMGRLLLIVVSGIAIWHWKTPLVELLILIADRNAIVEYLQQFGAWGPIVLSAILGIQVFLAFIPGHAFIVAGGYVYGFVFGALITQFSTVITSQLAYLLARKYGRPFVTRMAPAQVIDRCNALAAKQGGLFFFFSFILPIFPNDLMSFIAGLSSINAKQFFVVNFFGRLPCAIFFTLIGSHGVEMPIYFWIVAILVILGLCASWKTISAQIESQFLGNPHPINC